jgi:alkylation response protein AidB-like acyl-CoA dehydrogenase
MAALADLDLGPAANAFRAEVRAFLDQNWNAEAQAEARARCDATEAGFDRDFTRRLAERGWLGISWPARWGGQERSALEQLAFVEEMEYHRAPVRAHAMAVSIVGPALMSHGSDAQRERFLPRILRGELAVCLGYSEPDAGSDLASLRTRARPDGDGFVIDGAKLYTTLAERADYCWLAVRTDPEASKHAGISVLLVPMDSPGITVRPLHALGGHRTNAVFYDSVRVPADALVGPLNGGWAIITEALAFERVMLGGKVARVRRELDELVAQLGDDPLRSDPRVRDSIGRICAELEAARMLALRCILELEAGRVPHHEAAMAKVFCGELEERLAEAALEILGPGAALAAGSLDAELDGLFEHVVRASLLDVIGGGTNDIQRTLIAVRGLGLPR